MTQPPDQRPPFDAPSRQRHPPRDDEELGRLVRDSVETWTMPPVRVDQPGWRERVRSPRARRAATLRGWIGTLGRAATAAVAVFVGAAFLGVWLTMPHGPASPSQSPRHTDTAVKSPNPTGSGPAASQLPKLLVEGAVPTPSQVVVNVESKFSIVDLGTGTLGQPIASGQWGTVVRRAPDGFVYCICLAGDGYARGSFTHMTVTWTRYAGGAATSSDVVGEYRGEPDPADGADPDQPQNVAVRVSFGPDPGVAFVGWTVHAHPAWKSGIVVVDVSNGAILQRIDLPDTADGTATSRTGVDAPQVIGAAAGGRLAIARPTYTWSPPASANATYHFGADAFVAVFDGERLSNVRTLGAASQCGDQVIAAGTLASGNWWLGCAGDQYRRTVVRRLSANDHVIGDTQVSTPLDVGERGGGTSAVAPDGSALFLWSPMALVLTRVDLETGDVSTGKGETASAGGPLTALGRWLTPTAAAKVLLSSGIAISPDGSRVYVIGVNSFGAGTDGATGSQGLFVFEASSLAQVDHWAPTADFVSIAVSADGRFVYAAGSPGATADGQANQQPASITVFDAGDGAVHLIAGQLGNGFLVFPSTIIR